YLKEGLAEGRTRAMPGNYHSTRNCGCANKDIIRLAGSKGKGMTAQGMKRRKRKVKYDIDSIEASHGGFC
ncbi:MAG: hypothetical protein ACLTBV_19075, partial [Enterocloster bolteae]